MHEPHDDAERPGEPAAGPAAGPPGAAEAGHESRARAAARELWHTLLLLGGARLLRDVSRPPRPREPRGARPPRVAAPDRVPAMLPRRATAWLLALVAAGGAVATAGAAFAMGWVRTPYVTGQYAPIAQPVPFSHQLHATAFEIECRYCHASAARAREAGMPDSRSCVPCHNEAWLRSDWFAPVRRSVETGAPIRWRRVTDLADHVYFNHAVHVRREIACASCHGDVARMETTYQAAPLTMEWCVSCHMEPARWPAREGGAALARTAGDGRWPVRPSVPDSLAAEVARLTTCTACHR